MLHNVLLVHLIYIQLLLSYVALESAKAESSHFQDISKKLQNTVVATQREIEVSHRELEAEKNAVAALEVSLESLRGQLEIALQEKTKTHQQLSDREGTIRELQQETHSLSLSQEEIIGQLQEKNSELMAGKEKLKEVL